MTELDALGQKFGTDKSDNMDIPKFHAYLDIYERYLAPRLRDSARTVLEIGVLRGASLKMWAEYFKEAHIYGLDCGILPKIDNERIHMIKGNQANREDLARVIRTAKIIRGQGFDMIVDDGGHWMEQQQVSLGFLLPFVAVDGLYVIEDLSSSYDASQYPNWAKWLRSCNPTKTEWTTLKIVRALCDRTDFASDFMTPDEIAYLKQHVGSVVIERGRNSEIVFIRKKVVSDG